MAGALRARGATLTEPLLLEGSPGGTGLERVATAAAGEIAAIELVMRGEDAGRLLRSPLLAGRHVGRVKTSAVKIVWHDTADAALAARGLALSASRGDWRLERLAPGGAVWLPATPAPVLGSGPSVAAAFAAGGMEGPDGAVAPVAAFSGRQREVELVLPLGGSGLAEDEAATAIRLLADGSPDAAISAAEGAAAADGSPRGNGARHVDRPAEGNGAGASVKLASSGGQDFVAGRLMLLEGSLRGVLEDRPVCRAVLSGERRSVAALAESLGVSLGLEVPRGSLAAEGLALARGVAVAPRRLGTASVAAGSTVSEAVTATLAHLVDVMLHWAGAVEDGAGAEPVHQMRVAVRRMRSALSVFRRAVGDEAGWLDAASAELRRLGQLLGAARDWDVFLAETGAAVREAVPEEKRVGAMLAAAERKRQAAYAALRAYLDDAAGWRVCALRLALLPTARPWEAGTWDLAEPARDYARKALSRRLKHVLAPGDSLEGLSQDALHEVRKQGKRLRYAIEFFAPLFPEKAVRKYLRHLEAMQEEFGVLNDAAVAGTLVRELHGAFAEGLVQGFVATRGMRAVRQVRKSWGRFYREEPFWE